MTSSSERWAPVHAFIAAHTGMALSAAQRRRLDARLESLGSEGTAGRMVSHLRSMAGAADLARLVGAVAVHTSEVFRDEVQLAAFREHVLSPRVQRSKLPLRVWSAGCAAGEEVATLLVMLAQEGADPTSRVLGTDISEQVLNRARELSFPADALRRVPDVTRARYFQSQGGRQLLVGSLRTQAGFRSHNLMELPYPEAGGGGGFDIIFCRNVLIYFTPEAFQRTVRNLSDRLAPGGVLVLSAAEPLLQVPPSLRLLPCEQAFFYVRVDEAEVNVPTSRRDSGRFPAVSGEGAPKRDSGRFASVSSEGVPKRDSGRFASVSSEGVPTRDSGRFPTVSSEAASTRDSDRFPTVSGEAASTRDSGRFPSVASEGAPKRDSGRIPAVPGEGTSPRDSGRIPAVPGEGTAPRDSGRFPAVPGEGTAPRDSGRFPAVSGEGASKRDSGRIPAVPEEGTSPRDAGRAAPESTEVPLARDSGRFPAVPPVGVLGLALDPELDEPSPEPPSAEARASTMAEADWIFSCVLDGASTGVSDAQAELDLRRCLDLDPDHVAARYLLGLLLEQCGRPDIAVGEYRRARDAVDSGRARAVPFFLNLPRLRVACARAVERLEAEGQR
ncbi:CheR family methyltransferase [Corallococcus terminator]|uniref:CheR family methyltransferase n=1 Tax=Corallococcus terminator TaxID=2316733 RepID=UPI001FC96869|nr:CheR family methyltransferase [Corallococcus terminator]